MKNSNHTQYFLVAVLVLFGSISAQGMIQTYEARGSWRDQADCSNTAAAGADAFKKQVAVISSSCTPYKNDFKLAVVYSAEKKVETVSTLTRYITLPELQGGYRSHQECFANLPAELSIFRTQTGLEPFIAVCFNESGDLTSYGQFDWNLRIEALGPAAPNAYLPNEIATNLVGFFLTPESEIRQAIWEALVTKGFTPAWVQAHHASSIANLIKVRAYAPRELDLIHNEFATFTRQSSCFREATRVNTSQYAREEIYLTAFCMSETAIDPNLGDATGRFSLKVAYLASGLEHKDRPQKLPARFATYEDCDSQRVSIVSELEKSIGKSVRASFCGKLYSPDNEIAPAYLIQVIE